MARLIPTARAMSSICASATPRSSNRVRVAARIAVSRARRRTAVDVRRTSGWSVRVPRAMAASYDSCNSELHTCDTQERAVVSNDTDRKAG